MKKTRILSFPTSRQENVNPFSADWTDSIRQAGMIDVATYSDAHLIRLRPSSIHFHWPEYLICPGGFRPLRILRRAARLLLWFVYTRLLRGNLVWTVHNATPHDLGTSRIDSVFYGIFTRLVTHRIHLSRSSLVAGQRSARQRVVKHPVYEIRIDTETPGDGWVTFGEIKAYKGFEELVDAWDRVRPSGATLTLAGAGRSDALEERLRRSVAASELVDWDNRRLTDDELARLVSGSAGVVLNYAQVLNSGAALFALSCGRPVVLPDVPTFRELQDDFGEEWVYLFSPDERETLEEALRSAAGGERTRNAEWSDRSWRATGVKLSETFMALAKTGSGRESNV